MTWAPESKRTLLLQLGTVLQKQYLTRGPFFLFLFFLRTLLGAQLDQQTLRFDVWLGVKYSGLLREPRLRFRPRLKQLCLHFSVGETETCISQDNPMWLGSKFGELLSYLLSLMIQDAFLLVKGEVKVYFQWGMTIVFSSLTLHVRSVALVFRWDI